jgi:hypothetical protein
MPPTKRRIDGSGTWLQEHGRMARSFDRHSTETVTVTTIIDWSGGGKAADHSGLFQQRSSFVRRV